MSKFDDAIGISQENETGAARIVLADKIEFLISDRGEHFAIWNYLKGTEKIVSAEWANKFLNRAFNLGPVISVEW